MLLAVDLDAFLSWAQSFLSDFKVYFYGTKESLGITVGSQT